MNRKNLTAAVLAGLAGAAGIAGTAQAVNLNPDGLGQVLLYPYYTTNAGNQTLLSVVNTTDNAKAVKVRFLEGFNSREVLDFNLYLSAWDVWVAALADDEGTPTLHIPDDSCTVPYLYGDFGGKQPLLSLSYNDNELFSNDNGPTGIARAAEGHFEMIEMGTIESGSPTEADITHKWHDVKIGEDDDGKDITEKQWFPGDCGELVKNWTRDADYSPLGLWTCGDIGDDEGCANNTIDIDRNSGGLFGGAAIVNAANGTMYSYNAQALQGYDDSDGERHREPGLIWPSLNSGNQRDAYVFFGVPQNEVQRLWYPRPVGAVSAVFMHENIMNEYTLDSDLGASTEWVVTFPTKNWYVDEELVDGLPGTDAYYFEPLVGAPNCNNWMPGDENPVAEYRTGGKKEGIDPNDDSVTGWELCTFEEITFTGFAIRPFTELFDGKACELATIQTWDRDERTYEPDNPTGTRPPVVSPSIPGACDPEIQVCEPATPFELCYEVNIVRFGDGEIFGTPEVEGSSLLISVENEFENGWGQIDFSADPLHVDRAGLVGLPATGFAAYEFENDFLADDVKAYYGGLFGHKGNVRRTNPRRGQDD